MTIQELFPGAASAGPADDRLPPQDLHAEQSVLGGMLLSKDAIADCVEVLRSVDFYRPAHEGIYEAVLNLYGRGEPADAITVSDELSKRGDLTRVGGQAYLHQLVSLVPTAANAGYYAQIVAERAVLRRLVEAGTKIVQLGYAQGGGDVEDIVNAAQAEVYAVADKRGGEDYSRLGDVLEMTVDEIEVASGKSGEMTGVPTGFTDLDSLTNGFHAGQMIVVAARPAIGKALALDTSLPTPTGWTTMGQIQVGDYLMGADGKPTRVVAATEVMVGRPCYQLDFSDGEQIIADADHQWVTTTRASRRASSERRPQTRPSYWTDAEMTRLSAVTTVALNSPDRLVTTAELLDEVGDAFRDALRAQVIKHVPSHGREKRSFVTRATGRLSPEAVAEIRRLPPRPGLYAELAARYAVSERTVRRASLKSYTPAAHGEQQYFWAAPVYSRQLLLKALLDHASRPVVSWNQRDHVQVKTSAQIADSLRHETPTESRLNHAVPVCQPLDLPSADLLVPPYTLGAWLGDGNSASSGFTCADPEIVQRIAADGVVVRDNAGPYHYGLSFPPPADLPARACAVCGDSFRPKYPAAVHCGRSHGPGVDIEASIAGCIACGGPGGGRTGLCQACWLAQTFQGRLQTLGVLRNKHIPPRYLRASQQQRRDLLAGLLDTDGYAAPRGLVQFANTNPRLVDGVVELVRSLGYKPTVTTKRVAGRSESTSTCFTVSFTPGDRVFHLRRKSERQAPVKPNSTTRARFITGARRVPSVPVRCVEVESLDHLYLAGRSMIPTHNSTLGLDIVRSASIRHNLASVIFSLEMSKTEITMRLLSAEAGIQLQHMRKGTMREEDWTRLASTMGRVSEAPLFIDDSPNMSLMEIRAKCRRLKQRHNLKLVVIDYLQLMSSGKRVESRQQEVSEFSRALKLLAKELEVPVIAISQLNRGPEQRTDKKPQMSDLRESGSIEQDADMVILLHREEAYERESPRAGEADLIVAKHRNGPTDTIVLAFQGHYSRFTNMASSF